jgi:D-glycero-D-manno-heptose 1,7-bisphosphate phosphatase
MLIDGAWCWVSTHGEFVGGGDLPALFLDRDNLLIADPGFIHDPADVVLLAGASRLVRLANDLGIPVIVTTNQSGIGRGYYDWDAFAAVNARLLQLLAESGAAIDAIVGCGWHRSARDEPGGRSHPWRKPQAGMMLECRTRFGIDLERSWMVGDRWSDMRAARAGGLAGGLLVRGGDGFAERPMRAIHRLRARRDTKALFRCYRVASIDEVLDTAQRLFGLIGAAGWARRDGALRAITRSGSALHESRT